MNYDSFSSRLIMEDGSTPSIYFQPTDLPLTSEEQAFADYQFSGASERGEPAPEFDMMSDPKRAPSNHAALWKPLRELAHEDVTMKRAYGILPDSIPHMI